MTRNPLNPPDWTARLVVAALAALLLVVGVVLVSSAMAGATPTDDEACYEDAELVLHEATREVVVQEELVELEHQLAKHTRERTKDRHGWSGWSEPTIWEPLSHETWVTEIPEPNWQPHARSPRYQRDWALLPTGYSDTVLIQPQITETETDWFAQVPDGWTPTGETRIEVTSTEVDCPEPPIEEPPVEEPPAEEPPLEEPHEHECVTPEGHPYSYNDPTDGDCGIAEPTPEPPAALNPEPIAEVETLPRTGVETWHLAVTGIVLAAVGTSLLIVAGHDRRHTTTS